jgi:hypothetical protein
MSRRGAVAISCAAGQVDGGSILNVSVAQIAVGFVIVAAVAATAFRVSTGPDRARQRRDIARQVCIDSGGRWLLVEREEICEKPTSSP